MLGVSITDAGGFRMKIFTLTWSERFVLYIKRIVTFPGTRRGDGTEAREEFFFVPALASGAANNLGVGCGAIGEGGYGGQGTPDAESSLVNERSLTDTYRIEALRLLQEVLGNGENGLEEGGYFVETDGSACQNDPG